MGILYMPGSTSNSAPEANDRWPLRRHVGYVGTRALCRVWGRDTQIYVKLLNCPVCIIMGLSCSRVPCVGDWSEGRVRPEQTPCLLVPFPSVTGIPGTRTVTNVRMHAVTIVNKAAELRIDVRWWTPIPLCVGDTESLR
jgi:hypothetical protein